MQVKKQHLEPDMEQWNGSKLQKEYVKDVYCYSAYLTYMQNAGLDEAHAWIKIVGININNLRYRWHHPYGRNGKKKLKILLTKVKEESERVDLEINIQKTKIPPSGSSQCTSPKDPVSNLDWRFISYMFFTTQ